MNKAVVVGHVSSPCMGWLEGWLQEHFGGHRLYLAPTDPLPDPDALHGPVIVLGGPVGVGDIPRLRWLAAERDWIGRVLEAGLPYLGICLGAQLMASALGHHVGPCPRGTGAVECGYYRTHSARLPEWVYHWHRDGIFWREGSPLENLASSPWLRGKTPQAIALGKALGVQFHPEISSATIRRWLERDARHLDLPGARPARTHLPDHLQHAPAARAWLQAKLAKRWALPHLSHAKSGLPSPTPVGEEGEWPDPLPV